MTVDDTFDFIKQHRRVESYASTFSFHAQLLLLVEPPLSGIQHVRQAMYNHSFGRRNDSTASSSSVAMSYAKHSADSGISTWGHLLDHSVDSVMSDFLLGRSGLGDKVFSNAADLGPLTSIMASPDETGVSGISNSEYNNRNSYGSIIDEYWSTLLGFFQFRPLSMLSLAREHSPMKEGDTMISALGGGYFRCCSVGSLIEASPCLRVEKRKHSAIQEAKVFKNVAHDESPNKARIAEKPSIASTTSCHFGGERMIEAQRGFLEEQSLEDSVLVADGEDPSGLSTSSNSISPSPNTTHPMSSVAGNHTRACARGTGRRRYSKTQMSRSSVYQTVEEELPGAPSPAVNSLKDDTTTKLPVFIVDSDTASIHSSQGLEELVSGMTNTETVIESKRAWSDTPFSLFAVQSFQPPRQPAAMQALLEHSVQCYGPLHSELRPPRGRTSSRPSPYPKARASKTTLSPDSANVPKVESSNTTPVLRNSALSPNVSIALSLIVLKPFSPLFVDVNAKKDVEPKRENAVALAPNTRLLVASGTRRNALR
ncbi:hypothetical protein NLJ89_g7200 [Agrocybe chaxingu]|uniref:Uncharacterized protein n=1 Tax=Agrocybe chaxingu TaxID=84603 RepID=A0A9W8JWU1_9AGAR|nr:hypothetical protein NLJ89_g7200 [Agrocybe chaxingu]